MIRLFALVWKVHRGWGKGWKRVGRGRGEQYALIESKVYEHLKRNKCRLEMPMKKFGRGTRKMYEAFEY